MLEKKTLTNLISILLHFFLSSYCMIIIIMNVEKKSCEKHDCHKYLLFGFVVKYL